MVVFHAKECNMIRSKTCFKCNAIKPLEDFYKHSMMLDGHVNKCKECNKKDVIINRNKKIDYYRQYDKERNTKPHRVASKLEYVQTEAGKKIKSICSKNYEQKYPYKKLAVQAIAYAIRKGKIIRPSLCQNCNNTGKIHGHHNDYSKPYEVRWLCVKCHTSWHKLNQPIYPYL